MPEDKKRSINKSTLEQEPIAIKRSGKFIFANGDCYEGEYESRGESIERCGTGTFTSKDGVAYTGEWYTDQLNGKGSFVHPSGMRYDGDFVSGKFDGIGTYTWPDGSSYEGEFKECRLEGSGVFRDVNRQVWTGKFRGNAALGLRFKLNM